MTTTTGRLAGYDRRLPCRTDSARRRHLAHGRTCATCGVGHEPLPGDNKEAA